MRALAGGRDTVVDLTPILADIVRQWRRVDLRDVTAPQALALLGALYAITEPQASA